MIKKLYNLNIVLYNIKYEGKVIMAKTIDGAIKRVIYDNIIDMEDTKDDKCIEGDAFVSLSELLEVGKRRYDAQDDYFKKYIYNEASFIEKVTLGKGETPYPGSSHYIKSNVMINLWVNELLGLTNIKYKPIMLSFDVDGLTLVNADSFSKSERDIIEKILLNQYKDLIMNIGGFGIVNNYNKEHTINAIHPDFSVRLSNRSLVLSLNSIILQELDKDFFLSYHYDQDFVSKHGSMIETELGKFNLQTNVYGLKRMLSSNLNKNYFRNEELNPIVRLLDNIGFDYDDLEEYLKHEVSKVRTLKK